MQVSCLIVVGRHPGQQDEGAPVMTKMGYDERPDRSFAKQQSPRDLLCWLLQHMNVITVLHDALQAMCMCRGKVHQKLIILYATKGLLQPACITSYIQKSAHRPFLPALSPLKTHSCTAARSLASHLKDLRSPRLPPSSAQTKREVGSPYC